MTTHNVCNDRQKAGLRMGVVSSLCPVSFSSPATLRLSSTTLAVHFHRRPVKSEQLIDSTHRCGAIMRVSSVDNL